MRNAGEAQFGNFACVNYKNIRSSEMSKSEKPVAEQLAEISIGLKLKDIDQRTIDNTKTILLDCLGCTLSGSKI